jgi:hypothetical protein
MQEESCKKRKKPGAGVRTVQKNLDIPAETCDDRIKSFFDLQSRNTTRKRPEQPLPQAEGVSAMIHFSCDFCGKELRPGDEQRYVVKMEAYAAQDPAELTEDDLDDDNLQEISQLIQDGEVDLPAPSQQFRYDLCCECHRRFLRDPLGKKQHISLFTSEN